MIRIAIRFLLLAVLLLVVMFAVRTSPSRLASAPKSNLYNGYGSTIETLKVPEPVDVPVVEVDDLEMATAVSRLSPNCPSIEVTGYARDGDLEAFAVCLRAGNDPWIIEAPTDENARKWDLPGDSALQIASANGHLGIVELLVRRYRVSPDWGGRLQAVPVVAAIEGGHYDVADFLLKAGADTRRWTPYRKTALYAAVVKDDPKYLQAVLDAGAFPNDLVTDEGDWPLNIAIRYRHYEHARMLAEHGACVPRNVRELERKVERTRRDTERRELRYLVSTIHALYDPTCQRQITYEGQYTWEVDRVASEVEIAQF